MKRAQKQKLLPFIIYVLINNMDNNKLNNVMYIFKYKIVYFNLVCYTI